MAPGDSRAGSQIVWDAWIEIHPDTARRLEIAENDLVRLAAPQGAIELPAHLTTGVHPEALAVPIGQGHTSYGRYAKGRGANPWPLLPADRMTVAVKASRVGTQRELITPIGSSNMLGRPIVEVMTLEQFQKGIAPPPWEEPFPEPYETYPPIEYPKHEWGMTIDLNSCTGCSACVAACYAENNVPVVGKEEVAIGRIMSWIRMDRYFPNPTLRAAAAALPDADAVPAMRSCAVRAGLSGVRGGAHRRGPQWSDLQSMRRHALLRKQLSLQGAPLQLLRARMARADPPATQS